MAAMIRTYARRAHGWHRARWARVLSLGTLLGSMMFIERVRLVASEVRILLSFFAVLGIRVRVRGYRHAPHLEGGVMPMLRIWIGDPL